MSKRGLLMVLSGPSGVGKDAVRLDFLKECPTIHSSVSATTRPIRPGEIDGEDYFFLTQEKFDDMVRADEFLEYTLYNQKSYGTPRQFVYDQLESGQDVLLKIDVKGALNVKRYFPDAVLVFLAPPSMRELWRRIVGRNSGTHEDRVNRFHLAYSELDYAKDYDYIVVNDWLSETVSHLSSIYQAEKMRQRFSGDFCESLKKENIEDEISAIQ